MAEIKLKTDQSDQAIVILREAMKTEELRIKYAMDVAKKKLAEFEKKYGVSSETFINEWAAEDLDGRDLEYVEWAGEIKLSSRLNERFDILRGIEYIA
ncbi:MAG: hypothetical protein AVO38_09170 [delta proteobacterium ML8_D]|nr:MAG: hypothetical protein AVO38_09170 [delta proteobacterium ML8_D]